MSAAARLIGFTALLVAIFAGAALAGDAFGPQPRGAEEEAVEEGGHGAAMAPVVPVRGLSVAEGGLRLEVDRAERPLGVPAPLRFRVVDDRGRTVRDREVR